MTPLPTAIVLAGTPPHIQLVENLKNRGYHTVLVDYYACPPAKAVADEHIQESTLDRDAVMRVAKDRNASLVITSCMDHANVTACYVAEKLGLPSPYSFETALAVTDKRLMKDRMMRSGISTPRYVVVRSVGELDFAALSSPLIIKPADSNGSKGVRRAATRGEACTHIDAALRISRIGCAIVEEFITGREIGVDCLIQNGEAHILMIKERCKIASGQTAGSIQQISGCIWPASLSEAQGDQLKFLAESVARAFDLSYSPLMMQVILDDCGFHVIEVAARYGGGESHKIIQLSTGIDIIDISVNSFLGIPTSLGISRTTKYYADSFLYARRARFGYVSGSEQLLEDQVIEYTNIYKSFGEEIGGDLTSNNRVGVFVVASDTHVGLARKLAVARSRIEVHDIAGSPIMRRDIYS